MQHIEEEEEDEEWAVGIIIVDFSNAYLQFTVIKPPSPPLQKKIK